MVVLGLVAICKDTLANNRSADIAVRNLAERLRDEKESQIAATGVRNMV